MDKLGLRLLKNAPSNICIDGIRKLNETNNINELIAFYIKNIDFCLDNSFPNAETLLVHGRAFLKQNGIFINENTFLANIPFLVSLGNSDLKVAISDFSVSQIYAKDNSKINVSATGNAYVMIDAFDDTAIHVTAKEEARVIVNLYGNSTMTGNGVAKQKHKNKY